MSIQVALNSRQAKVRNPYSTSPIEHHIGRFQITVYDTAVVRGGQACAQGAGILVMESQNDSIITRSLVMRNSAATEGGGIWNGGEMRVDKSLVLGNDAGCYGGGIFNKASLSLKEPSRVMRNTAGCEGGGVYNSEGGTLSIDRVFAVLGNSPDDIFDAN